MWTGTQFVAVGENAIVLTSINGDKWEVKNVQIDNIYYEDITWTDENLVVVGCRERGSDLSENYLESIIITSTSVEEWHVRYSLDKSILWAVACSGNTIVAVGYSMNYDNTKSSLIVTSTDG